LYLIPFAGAHGMLQTVPVDKRAHPLSVEYIIESLPRSAFDVIELTVR
jgi:hypothetical protein